jgi:hypothetical protein
LLADAFAIFAPAMPWRHDAISAMKSDIWRYYTLCHYWYYFRHDVISIAITIFRHFFAIISAFAILFSLFQLMPCHYWFRRFDSWPLLIRWYFDITPPLTPFSLLRCAD